VLRKERGSQVISTGRDSIVAGPAGNAAETGGVARLLERVYFGECG